MPIPVAPMIIAGVGAAIGYVFQSRAATINHARGIRDSELQKARSIFAEITETMGSVLYFNEQSMYGATNRNLKFSAEAEKPASRDMANWNQYQDVLAKWKAGKTRLLGQVERYFDEDTLQRLQQIYGQELDPPQDGRTATGLILLERMVNATYYERHGHCDIVSGDGKSDNYYKKKYHPELEEMEKKATELAMLMTKQIQQETIGVIGGA